MAHPQVNHENRSYTTPRRVFFTGAGALAQGQALCYDRDFTSATTGEAATDAYGGRDKKVAMPTSTNNNVFAGVAFEAYSARSAGQWIYINCPGTICPVLTTETSLTLGELTFITANASATADDSSAGKFVSSPVHLGRGTARVMQTIAAAGVVLAELLDGPDAGMSQDITLDADGGAIAGITIGGVTRLDATSLASVDATFTLADGTYLGQRKTFRLSGAAGGSGDFVVTVTSGVALDGSSALATLTMDALADESVLEWGGATWRLIHNSGTALA